MKGRNTRYVIGLLAFCVTLLFAPIIPNSLLVPSDPLNTEDSRIKVKIDENDLAAIICLVRNSCYRSMYSHLNNSLHEEIIEIRHDNLTWHEIASNAVAPPTGVRLIVVTKYQDMKNLNFGTEYIIDKADRRWLLINKMGWVL